MLQFRPFLNTDPTAIIEIWQKQKPIRCLAQVVTRKVLDQMVFAKPYFDSAGFILAFDGDKPVGFIHVGFCPNAEMGCIDYSNAILCQIRIVDHENEEAIADGLWQHAETYLRSKDANVCHAGGKFPFSPFYVGLYGGSRIPGIPAEDTETKRWLNRFGFQIGQQIDVMQLNLTGFRPPVSRSQMAVRRQYQVAAIVDPLLSNWWECCTFGWAEVFGFRVIKKNHEEVLGSVMFWEIQPLSSQWGRKTMGLVDLRTSPEHQQQGLATYLVGESLRHMAGQGVVCVEFQMPVNDEGTKALASKFGFETVSTGHEMRRSID